MTDLFEEKTLLRYTPMPAITMDAEGTVTNVNDRIGEVFVYTGIEGMDIFAVTGIKPERIRAAYTAGGNLELKRNGKTFFLRMCPLEEDNPEGPFFIVFEDVTKIRETRKQYDDSRAVMAAVHVDNFSELTETTADETNLNVLSHVDKIIREWAEKHRASITRYKDDLYFIVMTHAEFEKSRENGFEILERVRKIKAADDFPVTISIGIGVAAQNFEELDQDSADALDLALGRGGDQVVVKDGDRIEYYGGTLQSVESGDKGKSRVIAHALKHLMTSANNVMIMGHKNPDMDSFGAAIGLFRMAENYGASAHIVINSYNEALTEIYKAAKSYEDYSFISSERALDIATAGTLVIVVDTNRAHLTECPELLEGVTHKVMIDHHRMTEDSLRNLTLSHVESYASSTCELVTEIVQFTGLKRPLKKFETEALLAGIVVDTNRFAVKTGVRTFDAASWLKKLGADTTEVKKYFQSDLELFKIRARCIANAVFMGNKIGLSVCHGRNENAQIVNSQVADELLTVKGVIASFVAGSNENGKTVISARSLGDVNVQAIMEKFGGGGHLTTSGAQVDMSPEAAISELSKMLEKYLD